MFERHQRIIPLAFAAFLVAAPGCSSDSPSAASSESAAAPAAQDKTGAAPAGRDRAKRKPKGKENAKTAERANQRRGADPIFEAALNLTDLTDDQRKQVDALMKEMRAEGRAEKRTGMGALAKGVREGKVDVAAATPPSDPEDEARRAHTVESFQKLHTLLTAEQRATMARSLEESNAIRDTKDARVGQLLRGIPRDPAQQGEVDAALQKVSDGNGKADRRAERLALYKAFGQPNFDAKAFSAQLGAHRDPATMATALAAVVPLLDQDQRNKLADRLERPDRAGRPRRKG